MIRAAAVFLMTMAGCAMADANSASAILQAVIDLPGLQQYYHSDSAPDRVPLRLVCGDPRCRGAALEKFGTAVLLAEDAAAAGGAPYLAVRSLAIEGSAARVAFAYPVEGVAGEAELAQAGGVWKVTRAEVWEE